MLLNVSGDQTSWCLIVFGDQILGIKYLGSIVFETQMSLGTNVFRDQISLVLKCEIIMALLFGWSRSPTAVESLRSFLSLVWGSNVHGLICLWGSNVFGAEISTLSLICEIIMVLLFGLSLSATAVESLRSFLSLVSSLASITA